MIYGALSYQLVVLLQQHCIKTITHNCCFFYEHRQAIVDHRNLDLRSTIGRFSILMTHFQSHPAAAYALLTPTILKRNYVEILAFTLMIVSIIAMFYQV